MFAGCGKSYRLDTGQVSGRVTVDGEPVSKGFVVFVPPKGRRASGPLDAQGRYELKTYRSGDGAIVGTHRVGIIAYEDMDQYYQAHFDESSDASMPPAIVPEEYNDPFSSGLTFEVEPGANQADFALTKQSGESSK